MLPQFLRKNLSEEQLASNYRHFRARETIENAFEILLARWQIFLRPIRRNVKNVEKYVTTPPQLSLQN